MFMAMGKKGQNLTIISEGLKAMAHPDRIGILALLSKAKEVKLSVSQICERLQLNQPEVSRHLSILKNKDILVFEREGSHIFYSLNRNNLVFTGIENLFERKDENK